MHVGVAVVAVVACQNIARKLSAICNQTTPTMQIGATAREAQQRATCKCSKPLQGAGDATKARCWRRPTAANERGITTISGSNSRR